MSNKGSKWIKKNVISRYLMTDCPQQVKCFEILNLLLDNENTKEEENYFYDHIVECWSCFKDYELEKAIRELLKTKLDKKSVPSRLIEDLKIQIREAS